ncbi:hypothetical protein ACJX0J_017319, partial [Zea mays]
MQAVELIVAYIIIRFVVLRLNALEIIYKFDHGQYGLHIELNMEMPNFLTKFVQMHLMPSSIQIPDVIPEHAIL